MENCIFCKIVRGEVPSYKVYEDEHALIFMDIAKDVDGHMVAIPKNHVVNILDCSETDLSELMNAVRKVSLHLTENCGYEGVNLLNASGSSAGQSVGHFHIHIIPRKQGDNIDAWPHFTGAEHNIEEIYEKIKMM